MSLSCCRGHNLLTGVVVIEKARYQIPPILRTPADGPSSSRLRNFLALDSDALVVVGPRRIPPVPTPTASSFNNDITILTSSGYRRLSADQYINAIHELRPDIVVGLADLVLDREPGVKRRANMVDRTHAWTRETISQLAKEQDQEAELKLGLEQEQYSLPPVPYFAPLLPLSPEEQRLYIEDLATDPLLYEHIAGFALYNPALAPSIPEFLAAWPRLCLGAIDSPHALLRAIDAGVDLTVLPFVTAATDAGVALDFWFPAPEPSGVGSVSVGTGVDRDEVGDAETDSSHGTNLRSSATSSFSSNTTTTTTAQHQHQCQHLLPLGTDLWPAHHAADLSPLSPHCSCYTCTTFSRAYLRHLLSAREMLAWTLLQVHNAHVVDDFFGGVRACLAEEMAAEKEERDNNSNNKGNEEKSKRRFETEWARFERVYTPELPAQSGVGPR